MSHHAHTTQHETYHRILPKRITSWLWRHTVQRHRAAPTIVITITVDVSSLRAGLEAARRALLEANPALGRTVDPSALLDGRDEYPHA